jgi:hypothetical protein
LSDLSACTSPKDLPKFSVLITKSFEFMLLSPFI